MLKSGFDFILKKILTGVKPNPEEAQIVTEAIQNYFQMADRKLLGEGAIPLPPPANPSRLFSQTEARAKLAGEGSQGMFGPYKSKVEVKSRFKTNLPKVNDISKSRKGSATKIGIGKFGDIFEGLTGNKAVKFLLNKKDGEIRGAFVHPEIKEPIDIFWGDETKGLKKISIKHPEILDFLEEIITQGKIYNRIENRIKLQIHLPRFNAKAIIRLDLDGKKKTWLLTAFEYLTKKARFPGRSATTAL